MNCKVILQRILKVINKAQTIFQQITRTAIVTDNEKKYLKPQTIPINLFHLSQVKRNNITKIQLILLTLLSIETGLKA